MSRGVVSRQRVAKTRRRGSDRVERLIGGLGEDDLVELETLLIARDEDAFHQ